MPIPDAMLTLDEAMRKLADLRQNARSWAQALAFLQLKWTVKQHTGWDDEELTRRLDEMARATTAKARGGF
jgi:hypothetical protein